VGAGFLVSGLGLWATTAVDHRVALGMMIFGTPVALVGLRLLLAGPKKVATTTPPLHVEVRADNHGVTAGGNQTAEHGGHIGPLHIGAYYAAPVAAPKRSIDQVIRQLRGKTVRGSAGPDDPLRAVDTASVLQRCAGELSLGGVVRDVDYLLGAPFRYGVLPDDFPMCVDHWQFLEVVEVSGGTTYLTEFGREIVDRLRPSLAISDPKRFPRETAETLPRSLGSNRHVNLWRVAVSVTKEGAQANNVKVQVERTNPEISFLPVVAHEMHQDGAIRRDVRNIRYGDPPIWFDILSIEHKAPMGEPWRRLFIYRNEFPDPYPLNDGEIRDWWAKWEQAETVEITITAVPDMPELAISATYELSIDDVGDLQMRTK
jgi:hypothetical protein